MMANKFHQRPSEILGIEEQAIAIDFDTAAAVALTRWEQKQQEANALLIASNIAALMVGSEPPQVELMTTGVP